MFAYTTDEIRKGKNHEIYALDGFWCWSVGWLVASAWSDRVGAWIGRLMTFLILLFVLSGIALVAAGVEHQPLKTFLGSWIGNG